MTFFGVSLFSLFKIKCRPIPKKIKNLSQNNLTTLFSLFLRVTIEHVALARVQTEEYLKNRYLTRKTGNENGTHQNK